MRSEEAARPSPESCARPLPRSALPGWQRWPCASLALTAVFLAFVCVPKVRATPALLWTYVGTAVFLGAWSALLWLRARRDGRGFGLERGLILKNHYIQASVQFSVYLYWGWYWPNVYRELPQILSQLVFLYALDALIAWTRGRTWRIGCGPLPIILSTNIFIWFRDDLYVFQFLMVAVGVLGKEFVKWEREGKRTHIFNPSAFTLAIFSIVLIVTGTTHATWGLEIAATLAKPPHIYLWIFLIGLIVQYYFSVTLMTLTAAGVLWLLNLLYTAAFGTYLFVDTNIPIAIFLGLHLLVTDPSTSPRTNTGRIVFGALYGLGNFVLYWVFERTGVPEFYDKLLPVPVLNLSVQLIDRWAKQGLLGRFARWETRFPARKLNLAHMGCWVLLFAAMFTTGWVEGPHRGASIAFWKQAVEEGKPDADKKLLKVIGSQADQGSPAACNELGLVYMQGLLVEQDRAAAAHYFATACELGELAGCANLATQFLYLREARSTRDVERALGRLEAVCAQGGDPRACQLLGFAHETGRGRPQDLARARAFYEKACAAGDGQACLQLACLLQERREGASIEPRVLDLLKQACSLGSQPACEALQKKRLPPPASAEGAAAPAWWVSPPVD